MACRAVLRTIPFFQRVRKLSKLQCADLAVLLFRANILLRSAVSSVVGYETEFSQAVKAVRQALNEQANIDVAASHAFNAVGASVDTILRKSGIEIKYAVFACGELNRAVELVHGRDALSYSMKQIRWDANQLQQSSDWSTLLLARLWHDEHPSWHGEYLWFEHLLQSIKLRKFNFGVWSQWYAAVYTGKPVFGIRSFEIRRILERNIALGSTDGTFNKAFWERDTSEINADIARWVEEARQQDERLRAIGEGDTETLTDEDFRSKPASIQTTVRDGKVVLERDDPLTDLQSQTAEAATKDLADGLRQIAEEARLAQADPRAVAFLGQCATAIEAAVHDQTKLFESGRNQKALESYAATVDAEWGSLLSSRYSGLVAQFAQTLMRFDAWRAFVAKPVESGESIDPVEMSNNVEAAVEALSKHEAAFSDAVLQRLRTLSNNFRLAVHRQQIDDAAHPGWMQVPEVLQSDVAVSLSNVLLSYGQSVLQHVGPKIVDGAIAAGDKAANATGALLVTALLGGVLVYLHKKYPSLYGTVIKTIKKVRAVIKETEPE